jgi:chloride channel protein, CIC family
MRIAAPAVPLTLLPAFVVLGGVLGAVGVAFNRALLWSLDSARSIAQRVSPNLVPLAVGLLVGVLLVLAPAVTGGGEHLVVTLAAMNFGPAALVGLALVRFATAQLSYATGVPGGIFAPILSLATAIGVLGAVLLGALVELPEGAAAAFGVAAMGGLFTATVRAPLVGMVLALELTGAVDLVVPIILTSVVASMVAQALGGRPIYEQLLERTLALAGTPRRPEQATAGLAAGQEHREEAR